MNDVDVPRDFPHEFLSSVPGGQAKLLVHQSTDGQYADTAESLRAERWVICADLCEQLVEYVNKHVSAQESAAAYADKVARSVHGKRAQWRLSVAEVDWIGKHLRARFQQQRCGTSSR